VARNALLEYWKSRRRKDIALDDMPLSSQPSINPDELDLQQTMQNERERAVDCMPKCLAELPDDSRQLFLRYHQNENNHIDLRAQWQRTGSGN